MFTVISDTNRGRVRAENQDCVWSEKITLAGAEAVLCIVADGMGGHLAGDIASRLATEELARSVRVGHRNPHPGQVLAQSFARANAAVYSAAARHAEHAGMGTTMVAALLLAGKVYICHVGDSRAYKYASGVLTRLTHDHSVVEELLRHGGISPYDARQHPERHLLTRAVGISPDLTTDCQNLAWQAGEALLLCTDGLTEVLTDVEIESVLREYNDCAAVIEHLMRLALSRGAPDNVTILLAVRENSL